MTFRSALCMLALAPAAADDFLLPRTAPTMGPDLVPTPVLTSRRALPPVLDCGYVPNANIGWTGKESVTFVGTGKDAGQKCCDECKAKADEDPPCAAWVYIHDGHCYQKYDTGIDVTMTYDSSNSDAGILTPAPTCKECGYVPNANIGWTGEESVTFVGTGTDAGQKCCDECKAKANEDPPCAAWVYIHDGHCYQKYDTGIGVTMTYDSSNSDAGILRDAGSTPTPTPTPTPTTTTTTPTTSTTSTSTTTTTTSSGPGCTRLSGTYCGGTGQECNCNYCDDFCEDTPCARTCRVLNGYFSSPAQSTCQWSAAHVTNPSPDASGNSCWWMEGNGQGGQGDDCRNCDQYAVACRRANPSGNCRA